MTESVRRAGLADATDALTSSGLTVDAVDAAITAVSELLAVDQE